MSSAPLIESIFELDDTNLIAYNRRKTDFIRITPTTGPNEYANTSGSINFEINNQQYFPKHSFTVNSISTRKRREKQK